VLQAGGEEGMWTFDRYQRWMEQVSDWVRPPLNAPPRDATEAAESLRIASPRLPARATEAGPKVVAAPPAARSSTSTQHSLKRAVRSSGNIPADDVIEIPMEDMDLAQLAELAKKVIEPGNQ
jgi:hypothetical protein